MRKDLIVASLLVFSHACQAGAAGQPIRSERETFRVSVVSAGLEHP